MAKVVIIGAGFAGHTAALYLGHELGEDHEITVVNKGPSFCYLPSLIWVGVGRMKAERVEFPLAPVYEKFHVRFVEGRVGEIHPVENFVMVDSVGEAEPLRLDYDYLIVATGPKLDYAGTPGLGPDGGHTNSVCWTDHAIHCAESYLERVARLERGERVRFVIGTGHAMSTCQGAAFEYLANVHHDLNRRKLRDKADLVWLSNEAKAGDFGVGGVRIKKKDEIRDSEPFMRAVFEDFGVDLQLGRGVTAVDEHTIHWEDLEGREGETPFDFGMLIPRFLGPRLKWIGKDGEDLAPLVTNPGGFVLVDGFYGLPYDRLAYTPEAWPATYQSPNFRNIFAAGIAFAPPGPISQPHTNPNGMQITATAPRTGMVSATIGRLVAMNVIGLIQDGEMRHQERMTDMFAACIASVNDSLWSGSAVSVVVMPVVPNRMRYPESEGRDPFTTHLEHGLAGAWMKYTIHHTMLHKMRGRIGWRIIPE